MKVKEIIDYLEKDLLIGENDKKDGIVYGDSQKQVQKIAVAMFPTAEAVKKAQDMGADLFIVHEPVYLEGKMGEDDKMIKLKKQLVESSDMVIYRYHDHSHSLSNKVDQIIEGAINYLGLKGQILDEKAFDQHIQVLNEEISPVKLAKLIEKKFDVKHVGISGERNKKGKVIGWCLGANNQGVLNLLTDDRVNIVVAGEVCEWLTCEYARDCNYFGMNKSLLVLGHVGSEREGMRLLAERLSRKYDKLSITYVDCKEAYSYTG